MRFSTFLTTALLSIAVSASLLPRQDTAAAAPKTPEQLREEAAAKIIAEQIVKSAERARARAKKDREEDAARVAKAAKLNAALASARAKSAQRASDRAAKAAKAASAAAAPKA